MSKDLSQLSEDELKKMVFGTTATAPGQFDTWEEIIEKKCRRVAAKQVGRVLVVCDNCHSSAVFSKEKMCQRMDLGDALQPFGEATLLIRFDNDCTYCRRGRKGKFVISQIEQELGQPAWEEDEFPIEPYGPLDAQDGERSIDISLPHLFCTRCATSFPLDEEGIRDLLDKVGCERPAGNFTFTRDCCLQCIPEHGIKNPNFRIVKLDR